jgi:hypothetical protein
MICASQIELLSKQNDNTLFPATALQMFGKRAIFPARIVCSNGIIERCQ